MAEPDRWRWAGGGGPAENRQVIQSNSNKQQRPVIAFFIPLLLRNDPTTYEKVFNYKSQFTMFDKYKKRISERFVESGPLNTIVFLFVQKAQAGSESKLHEKTPILSRLPHANCTESKRVYGRRQGDNNYRLTEFVIG